MTSLSSNKQNEFMLSQLQKAAIVASKLNLMGHTLIGVTVPETSSIIGIEYCNECRFIEEKYGCSSSKYNDKTLIKSAVIDGCNVTWMEPNTNRLRVVGGTELPLKR